MSQGRGCGPGFDESDTKFPGYQPDRSGYRCPSETGSGGLLSAAEYLFETAGDVYSARQKGKPEAQERQILNHNAVYSTCCRRPTDGFAIAAVKAEHHPHDFPIPAADCEAI